MMSHQATTVAQHPVATFAVRHQAALLLAIVAVALAALLGSGWTGASRRGPALAWADKPPVASTLPDETLTVPPQTYKPLSPLDALAENARRPLDKRRLEIAFPFVFGSSEQDPAAWGKAVNCLALANYYEAASEGDSGMRAVSQVVLNRVRHPAFPHSVCEVVFQGAERATGCQFTFTCDGSLRHAPIPAIMARARAIAEDALRGRVEATVGMATHYHANSVVPYWADSLDKIRTLGAHIFYVWRGGWGNRAAFRAVYAGERGEASPPSVPPLPTEPVIDSPDGTGALASGLDRINLVHTTGGKKTPDRVYLVADEAPRSLKVDDDEHAGTLRAQPQLLRPSERSLSDGE